jgi:hypothetical protein
MFYRVKDVDGTGDYTEQDYQMLERYIISGDRPVSQYERTECLMDDDQYTILRAKQRPEKFKH